jgi:hypothetical protein
MHDNSGRFLPFSKFLRPLALLPFSDLRFSHGLTTAHLPANSWPSMRNHLPSLTVFLALFFWSASATTSRAEQFVMFDVTFTFTKDDAFNAKPNQSHYYVKGDRLNPQRPKDWTAPVDYRNGTVHVRLEVLEKPPGGQPTTWSVCYIPNKGQNHGYGCIGTGVYKEKGVYEKDIDMTSFWQNNDLVWTEGVKEMHLVIKDDHNMKVHELPEPEKFLPTKVRMTVIQVSKGAKYDPQSVPNLPSAAK